MALCLDCDSGRSHRCHKLDLLKEVPRIIQTCTGAIYKIDLEEVPRISRTNIIAYNEEEVENKGKW